MGKDKNLKCSVLSDPQLQNDNFCFALILAIYHSVVQTAVFAVARNFGMLLPILRWYSAVALKKQTKKGLAITSTIELIKYWFHQKKL